MADIEQKQKKPSQGRKKDPPTEPLCVVGIGVCAASFRDLIRLFTDMHDGLDAAYVVAVRQQDGLSVDKVVEALQEQTADRVKTAENGDRLESGQIYVGGGDQVITITDGHIASRPTSEPIGHRGTIDSLLISVAEHAHDRSVAVILAGLGSDGTAGVTATKQYGGLSIAQSLNGEADAAEQGAASPAGIVDLLLPLDQIPSQIALYIRGLVVVGTPPEGEISEQVASELAQIQRLEVELRLTKERLQATIEELESTNEELKSSNEEYQSINEELQSSNEELETSKEELQSVNEELQTVNTELDIRVRDLARANSDLRNLLESTQIATVFLDNDLRVRSFTPTATELFHLVETDVGRPIDHLGSRVQYPDLSDDVRKVLTKLGSVERDVPSKDGRSYIARVLPYRSIDNFIAGAVITFVDVTSTVKAESALRESEGRLRTLLAELQHRVRNTLAVVKSITQRTAESSSSVDQMAAHLSGRLDAFSRVQSAVTRNPERGIDLKGLLADELLAHAAHEGEQVSIKGPDVALRPKAAESISLAVHELTTNAVKHGALTNGGGRIDIRWKVGRDGAGLQFNWAEVMRNGTVPEPHRHGFGMELLTKILPYDLGATTKVEFAREGLLFAMQLPPENLADSEPRS